MYKIEICKGPSGTGRFENQWYVHRLPESLDPEFDYLSYEYLHQDGIWRPLTVHNGAYTGYFRTKKEAKEVLDSVSEVS